MPITIGNLGLPSSMSSPRGALDQPPHANDDELAVLLITGTGNDFLTYARKIAAYAESLGGAEAARAGDVGAVEQLSALERELRRALAAVESQRRRLAQG